MFQCIVKFFCNKIYSKENAILLFDVAGQNLHNLKQTLYKSKNKDAFRSDVITAKYTLSTFTKLTQTLILQNSNVFTNFVNVNKGESYKIIVGSGYIHTQGKSHILKLNNKFNVIRAFTFLDGKLTFCLQDSESKKCEVISFNETERRVVDRLFRFTYENVERLKMVQHDIMLEMINME